MPKAAKEKSVTKERKTKSAAPKEAKKAKKEKDPNAPKKNKSAFMFYSMEIRDSVKSEHPDAGFGEIGKIIGRQWGELSERDKKVRCSVLSNKSDAFR
mmetsp:Transcript_35270/g.57029  ORF Transcript_35270/g.57029 Transcript_35270/m.57029 type:complete len:98 (+) Transcript_35270:303-596(+)